MKLRTRTEAIELLPKSGADQSTMLDLDRQLKEKNEQLSKLIADRCDFLAEEKRKQKNIAFRDWDLKIIFPLKKLRNEMNYVNRYIYNHATQFSCCTTQAVKLQAKRDALQAYTIIEKIIAEKDYPLKEQEIDLFKIHNNNIRNGVLLIIAGVILFAVAMAIVVGGPFILAAITGGVLLAKSTMVMASLITVATAMLPVIGCSISIVAGMEKFSENRNDKVFRQSFSNTLSGFFHKDVTELLPSKEAPAPDAELTSSTVSQNQ